ncbi:bifunctional 3'-5' exonuclease/ATP-dependent helicase WRN-like [Argopecten irradians]|uniref:bifunctional 3'-5' exonuclease/ATP-dependent helicase WRN-like n=1 Tax=Argopecten irradians TaxID=31199 RepID=UPI003715A718
MAASVQLKETLHLFHVDTLKPEQETILKCLEEDKKDCMAVLPTGYGKSLPFQLYSVMLNRRSPAKKVVVCCPLIALMQDQVQKMSEIPEFRAAYAGSSTATDVKIRDGEVDLIYASPEVLVGDQDWRESLRKLDVDLIVIDKFHTIATWGEDEDVSQKTAFRKWFSYLGELRPLCPNATLLALSATCTVKIRNRVTKFLNLNPNEIMISPNKENIKIVAAKVVNDIEEAMLWITDGVADMGQNFPKTLIYCNSITDSSKLYSYLIDELPDCTSVIGMYHSECTKFSKDNILCELQKEESPLKVIICTDALGMGIDVVKCHSVVLYGGSKTIIDLVQKIGRAGRDGENSVALILFNQYNIRQADGYVKDILKTKDCRRSALVSVFDRDGHVQETSASEKHNCCDICASTCTCEECPMLKLEELFTSTGENISEMELSESDEDTESYNLSDYEDESYMMQHMDNLDV